MIYEASSAYVYHLALRMNENPEDAKEVAQEVFLKIYGSLGRFNYRSSFKTWVYRITINTAINHYRRRLKEQKIRGEWHWVQKRDSHGIFSDEVSWNDKSRIRDAVLRGLSPEQRACILLREMEGLNYQEISEVLSIKLNTVRTRIKRAREKILEAMRKEGIDDEM